MTDQPNLPEGAVEAFVEAKSPLARARARRRPIPIGLPRSIAPLDLWALAAAAPAIRKQRDDELRERLKALPLGRLQREIALSIFEEDPDA